MPIEIKSEFPRSKETEIARQKQRECCEKILGLPCNPSEKEMGKPSVTFTSQDGKSSIKFSDPKGGNITITGDI